MREMKDSGVPWIGVVPTSWTLDKISSLYTERSVKVSDKDYPALSVTKFGIVPQLESAAKTDNGDNRKLIKKNDFVINSRSDRRGSCGISEYEGSCSLINIVLEPREHMVNKYYNYLFKTALFADEFYKWGNGIVDDLWSTKWSSMKNIVVPSPPLNEQQDIADYLDRKCAQIDSIIAKEQAVIDKLQEYKRSVITEAVTKGLNPDVEMKASGVDWLTQCPVDWKLSKIKYMAEFNPKYDYRDVSDDTEITYTPMEYIKNGKFIPNTSKIGGLSSSLTKYAEGDIVMAKVTPCFENGNIAIMKNLANSMGMGSSELFVLKTSDIYRKFLFYWLQNSYFVEACIATMTGTGGLKRISSYFVINSEIFIPPLSELEQIVKYIDEKSEAIDKAIQRKQTVITKLTEYKQSLIYEVVTGKKEVSHV